MRILSKAPDGGENSGVTAYFLIEIKGLFSVALLRFNKGSRDAYHSHAFNALTWWLRGSVTEETLIEDACHFRLLPWYKKDFTPSLKPKFTPKRLIHKIVAKETTWALTFRGPWDNTWKEVRPEGEVTLTHGRKEI